MNINRKWVRGRGVVIPVAAILIAACASGENTENSEAIQEPVSSEQLASSTVDTADGQTLGPLMTVYKDEFCGCCIEWIDHMVQAGYRVQAINVKDLDAVKTKYGVAPDLESCHTAEVDGYIIEGHVPASAVKKLLAERPALAGLAVPGMPIGSPGMEVPGREPHVYNVVGFGDGMREKYMVFRGGEEIPQ